MQEQSYTSPWKKLTTKKIYENPWIRVEENDVIRPNGTKGMYGWIHFKNKAIGSILKTKPSELFLSMMR